MCDGQSNTFLGGKLESCGPGILCLEDSKDPRMAAVQLGVIATLFQGGETCFGCFVADADACTVAYMFACGEDLQVCAYKKCL